MARTPRAESAQNGFLPGFTDLTELGTDDLVTLLRARETGSGRTVSLTLITVDTLPPWAIETFDRETASLVALGGHPNLVAVQGTFRAADGRLVLVSTNCPRSFAARVQVAPGGRVPVAEVLSVGTKLAAGLDAAHRSQVLHREVRPGRIMITESGEPALTGFGIAALRAAAGRGPDLAATVHAAPELFGSGDFSPATDVYGLASTLYQFLVGRPAFVPREGETSAVLIRRVQDESVPPIVDQQIPAELSELLVQAMAKDPAARPTMRQLGSRLAAVSPPASGHPSSSPESPTPTARRTAPAATDWSAPTVSRHAAPDPAPAPAVRPSAPSQPPLAQPPSAPEPYRSEPRAPTSAGRARHAAPDETPAKPPRPAPPPPPVAPPRVQPPPAQPPAVPPPVQSPPIQPPAVPMWNFRAPEPAGVGAEMRLDPAALRKEVTFRASGASLTVDLVKLVSRQWLKKQEIPWRDVVGLDTRWDASGDEGVAVVITHRGPVELPATRGSATDLRTTHALLTAYRQRAHLPG